MSRPFKVVQFNMQFGQLWDDIYPDFAPVNLSRTIAELHACDADLIFLQEVERSLPNGAQAQPPPHFVRLQRELASYDSYFCYPKPDARELPFGAGLAIFSRTPLRDHLKIDLPSPPVEFEFFGEKRTPTDRLLIGATTTIDGRDVRLYNTHLLAFFMLNTTSEEHPLQRQLVEQQLRATGDVPALLSGDFNVSNHRSLIEQFGAAGFQTVQQDAVTWRRRPYVLDHIFHNRGLQPAAHEVRPTPASDHHLVIASFDFAPA